jgi:DNA-binding beta-propeller fold protein YncE
MKPLILSLVSVLVGLGLQGTVILAAERIVLVAGGGSNTNTTAPLKPAAARLGSPFGVDFDRAGNLYLVEMTGHYVRKLDQSGMLTVIAGTGEKGGGGDDGPALKAQFNGIHNLAVTPNADIYLADTWNNRVRKIDGANGNVTTIAGTGAKGFTGDGGPATEAQFGGIYCASLDPKREQLYLADLDNLRIRAVDLKTGRVRTVAGNGRKGVPMDGAKAIEAPLVDPRAVIADATGRVYVLERGGHALRVVETDGTIRTVVGTGQKGNTGDDDDARQATMNGPKHLCFDLEGNILIADTENHVVRKYLPREGRIVRIAGSGRKGRGDLGGPPLEVELNQPHGVHVHTDGTLYISDSSNHRVLKVVK